jgi:hypothetical protein
MDSPVNEVNEMTKTLEDLYVHRLGDAQSLDLDSQSFPGMRAALQRGIEAGLSTIWDTYSAEQKEDIACMLRTAFIEAHQQGHDEGIESLRRRMAK